MDHVNDSMYSLNQDNTYTLSKYNGTDAIPEIFREKPVTIIGDFAFCECELASVTIPSSIKTINHFAFHKSKLTSIHIPDSVTSIGDFAFSQCSELTSITIPNSVETIGNFAFSGSGLTSAVIPKTTLIGDGIFCDTCMNTSMNNELRL